MSNGSEGDNFNSNGGNMSIAQGRGTAIQINELHLHEQRQESLGKSELLSLSADNTHRPKGSGQVFISYAREDKGFAERLYNDLKDRGVPAWIDYEDMLPGQDWEIAIKEAIQRSSFFLAILSNHSVSKTGYVQKELKVAFAWYEQMPPSRIFVIPIRIEDCQPQDERLKKLHWGDLFPGKDRYEKGLRRILQVLRPVREARESVRTEFEIETGQERTAGATSPKHTSKDSRLISLRNAPQTLSREDVDKLKKHYRGLQNDFEDRGEVIVDHATALSWQQSGSEEWLSYAEAQKYVEALNRQKFAGYTDWRLPTLPELLSLLEPEKRSNDLYIDPIFDSNQWWCWSADTVAGSSGSAWGVSFDDGGVGWNYFQDNYCVRCVRS